MTCSNSAGTSQMESVTVSIIQPQAQPQVQNPTVNISANPPNVLYNGSSIIRWNSSNATSCSGSNGANGWAGFRALSGTFNTGALTTGTTYSITCSNSTGSDGDFALVSVGSQNQTPIMSGTITPSNPSCIILDGQNSCNINLSWNTVNPVSTSAITKSPNISLVNGNSGSSSFVINYPSTTFYLYNNNILLDTNYATANCASGTVWNGNVCQVPTTNTGSNLPSVNFTADQYGITYGNGTTLSWNSSYTSNCYASNGVNNWAGGKNTSGSFYTGALYYNTTFTITCSNNNSSLTRDVTITVGNLNNNNNFQNIPVNTNQYYNPTYIPSYVPSYTPTTIIPTTITTPPANTSTVVNRTVYVNNTTGTKSLVLLTIDGGRESIASGERRGYTVTWKNVSNQNLTNVILRVLFPASMNVETATKGSFKKEDNTLTLDIRTLSPNETEEMFITASTKIGLKEQELVVVVANLVFTDKSNTQHDALAYATHRVENNVNVLGANAFFAGAFLPSGIFGWLLLLILILIMTLLIKHLYQQSNEKRVILEPHY